MVLETCEFGRVLVMVSVSQLHRNMLLGSVHMLWTSEQTVCVYVDHKYWIFTRMQPYTVYGSNSKSKILTLDRCVFACPWLSFQPWKLATMRVCAMTGMSKDYICHCWCICSSPPFDGNYQFGKHGIQSCIMHAAGTVYSKENKHMCKIPCW